MNVLEAKMSYRSADVPCALELRENSPVKNSPLQGKVARGSGRWRLGRWPQSFLGHVSSFPRLQPTREGGSGLIPLPASGAAPNELLLANLLIELRSPEPGNPRPAAEEGRPEEQERGGTISLSGVPETDQIHPHQGSNPHVTTQKQATLCKLRYLSEHPFLSWNRSGHSARY